MVGYVLASKHFSVLSVDVCVFVCVWCVCINVCIVFTKSIFQFHSLSLFISFLCFSCIISCVFALLLLYSTFRSSCFVFTSTVAILIPWPLHLTDETITICDAMQNESRMMKKKNGERIHFLYCLLLFFFSLFLFCSVLLPFSSCVCLGGFFVLCIQSI